MSGLSFVNKRVLEELEGCMEGAGCGEEACVVKPDPPLLSGCERGGGVEDGAEGCS